MNELAIVDTYAAYPEPATLKIQRLLPGPIERVWAYLTDSDLRRRWLAAGDMKLEVGAPFEFVWRNDELTERPGQRPPGADEEIRLTCEITELDPPRRIAFSWGSTGGVSFDLERQGGEVLLTVTHRRAPDRSTLLNISTGWHVHLDMLAARLADREPEPFWDRFVRLKKEYDTRIPG